MTFVTLTFKDDIYTYKCTRQFGWNVKRNNKMRDFANTSTEGGIHAIFKMIWCNLWAWYFVFKYNSVEMISLIIVHVEIQNKITLHTKHRHFTFILSNTPPRSFKMVLKSPKLSPVYYDKPRVVNNIHYIRNLNL